MTVWGVCVQVWVWMWGEGDCVCVVCGGSGFTWFEFPSDGLLP